MDGDPRAPSTMVERLAHRKGSGAPRGLPELQYLQLTVPSSPFNERDVRDGRMVDLRAHGNRSSSDRAARKGVRLNGVTPEIVPDW
jgi:hypothetical protein